MRRSNAARARRTTLATSACALAFVSTLAACEGCRSSAERGGTSGAPPVASASPVASVTITAPGPLPPSGRVGHVFVIVLENKDLAETFGPSSAAPFLAKTLRAEGALLRNYFGIGHNSLPNYIALISGQGPNPDTQDDCLEFEAWRGTDPDPARDGQAIGRGCVYPSSVPTFVDQLEAMSPPRTWRGYMEDMGNDPAREARTCGHPAIGKRDFTQSATKKDQYATRHDPFVYFRSIIDDAARCDAHVVPLDALEADLASAQATPSFVFITPNLCSDGHDGTCASGEPAGLLAIDSFLSRWVPRILASAAYREDGMLVITFDESSSAYSDSSACCGEGATPNVDRPGMLGPGGGKVGAVVLSPFVAPGTVSDQPYNHYSLLRTLEDLAGVAPLGYAATAPSFGRDVFSRAMPIFPARP